MTSSRLILVDDDANKDWYSKVKLRDKFGAISMVQSASDLLDELLAIPQELEWLELKCNNYEPNRLGQYISALANTALLLDRDESFMIFGAEDGTRKIVGTDFRPYQEKVSNQALMMWLGQRLSPHVDFTFDEIIRGKERVILLTVKCPATPASFDQVRYIRIGSSKTTLASHPDKESVLWQKASQKSFESAICKSSLTPLELVQLLDFRKFASLQKIREQSIQSAIDQMCSVKLLRDRQSGRYDITNLGALLLATSLGDFGLSLKRKAFRVIHYSGRDKLNAIDEQEGDLGYAVGFNGMITYINSKLPHNELIGRAFRTEKRMYPEESVRELVANALIHQDLMLQGTGPLVEIYEDRVEITNPGVPLIDTDRFIDNPARSRNEALAYQMRQFNICEERGSGIKRALMQIELYQLPAPSFEVRGTHTTATIFAYKKLGEMSRQDKIRACYQHACLKWIQNEALTNSSLRERLGVEAQNYSIISRLIRESLDAGVIKPAEQGEGSKKNTKYLPYWASESSIF